MGTVATQKIARELARIAADSGSVYLLATDLTKVSIGSGAAEKLLRVDPGGTALMLDETNVYWISGSRVFKYRK